MACSCGVVRPTLRLVPLLLLLQGALVAPMSIVPLPPVGTRSWDVKFRRDGEEHTLRVPEGMPVLQVARFPIACQRQTLSHPHMHPPNPNRRPPRLRVSCPRVSAGAATASHVWRRWSRARPSRCASRTARRSAGSPRRRSSCPCAAPSSPGPTSRWTLTAAPRKPGTCQDRWLRARRPHTLLRQRPVSQPAAWLPGCNAPDGVRTMEGLGDRAPTPALWPGCTLALWRCDLEMAI